MAIDEKALHDAVAKRLVDQGKLIEAGWIGFRQMAVPAYASEPQIDDTRSAFFAGAQHLFGAVMGFLEEGEEPTDNDLRRMDQINAELAEFLVDFKRRHGLG